VDKLQGNEREIIINSLTEKTTITDKITQRKYSTHKVGEPICYSEPISEEAKQWEGFGSSLKPALEPITVARKPIEKGLTIAENCLKWGTGGIDIDGCRVETEDKVTIHGSKVQSNTFSQVKPCEQFQTDGQKLGRFPANLIHDGSDEVLSLFPNTKNGGQNKTSKGSEGMFGIGAKNGIGATNFSGDSGSASRFFYCAKASKQERNEGCEDLPSVENANGDKWSDVDRREDKKPTLRQNFHPTVKPILLMQYLVKLVSREGATVLDPFMGSGTTGIACKNLSRKFVGIERDAQYFEIATKRINKTNKLF